MGSEFCAGHLTYADEDHRLFQAKTVYSEQTEGFSYSVKYNNTILRGRMMREESHLIRV